MASWKKVITSGSDANLRNLVVSQSVVATSITGSLLGSATSAEIVVINSTTAPSNTSSGSLWFNTQNLTLYVKYEDPSGSSYWIPSFNVGIPLSSSYAESSSYVDLAQTASYVNLARTASKADTASYVVTAQTASYYNLPVTYSQAFTASFVNTARTASFVTASNVNGIVAQAYTASYVLTAQTASFVDTARTASYVDTARTASYLLGTIATASSAETILTSFGNYNSNTSHKLLFATGTQGRLSAYISDKVSINGFTGLVTAAALSASDWYGVTTASFSQTASYVRTAQTATAATTLNTIEEINNFEGKVLFTYLNYTASTAQTIYTSNHISFNPNTKLLSVTASNANTASFVDTSRTASFITASNVSGIVSSAYTASYIITAQTASFVDTARTASFVTLAQTASFVATAQTASRITGSNVVGIVSQAYTSSFISRLSQNVIITGSVETTIGITSSQLILTDNGNGTNLRIGDDAWIGDINTANTFGIRGLQNTGSGFIRFGNTVTSPLLGANNGSATLELSGSLALTGQLIQPTKVGFSVYGSGTTNNLTTTQNGDGTLNTNNFAIEFNQGSHLTGSTGIFTAPLTGLYQANLVARNAGYSSGISQIAIMKNNANTGGNIIMLEFAASSTMNHAGVSKVFYMVTGDTLRIRVLAGQINFDGNDGWSVVYLG